MSQIFEEMMNLLQLTVPNNVTVPFLRVSGKSAVRVAPDAAALHFDLAVTDLVQKKAAATLADQGRILQAALIQARFPSDSLVTEKFAVNRETSWDGKDHVFRGYRVTQSFILNLSCESGEINRALGVVCECGCLNNLSLGFSLKQSRKYQHRALREAYQDALQRAEVLAVASGRRLGENVVMNASHVSDWCLEESSSCMEMVRPTESMSQVDISPETQTIEAEVEAVWRLI